MDANSAASHHDGLDEKTRQQIGVEGPAHPSVGIPTRRDSACSATRSRHVEPGSRSWPTTYGGTRTFSVGKSGMRYLTRLSETRAVLWSYGRIDQCSLAGSCTKHLLRSTVAFTLRRESSYVLSRHHTIACRLRTSSTGTENPSTPGSTIYSVVLTNSYQYGGPRLNGYATGVRRTHGQLLRSCSRASHYRCLHGKRTQRCASLRRWTVWHRSRRTLPTVCRQPNRLTCGRTRREVEGKRRLANR